MGKKIRRAYVFLAVTAFHVLAGIVLVVLGLGWYYHGERPPPALYSPNFSADSYQLVNQTTADAVGLAFDRMGDAESFAFNPATLFMPRAFTSEYLNVNHDGTRHTPTPPPDDRPDYVVWCFGGSTMFGWGQPDSMTVAAHLRTILQEHVPRRRVVVINHSCPYWYSSQELSQFMALLRQSTPDVVVFLDGLNDARKVGDQPWFTDLGERAWERERQRYYFDNDQWIIMTGSFPLKRLGRSLNPPSTQAIGAGPDLRADAADTVPRFRANVAMMHAIGQAAGVRVVTCLQPVPLSQLGDEVAQFYAAIRADPPDGLVDLSDALDSADRPYVDRTHYSDAASKRVAEGIAPRVTPLPVATFLPKPCAFRVRMVGATCSQTGTKPR